MSYQQYGFDNRLRKIGSLPSRQTEYLTPLEQELRFERNPYAPPTFISKGTIQATGGGILEMLSADGGTVLLSADPSSGVLNSEGGLSVSGTTSFGSSVEIAGQTTMQQDMSLSGSAVIIDKNMVFYSPTNGNAFMSIRNSGNNERIKVEVNNGGFGFITADEYIFKGNAGNSIGENFGVRVGLADSSGVHGLRVFNSNGSAVWVFASNGEAYQKRAGFMELLGTIADPGGGPSNSARLFVKTNGSKLQLAVEFPTGTAVVLATEP